jgi:hypothetical protein
MQAEANNAASAANDLKGTIRFCFTTFIPPSLFSSLGSLRLLVIFVVKG